MNIRQRGTAAYVEMVVIVAYNNTTERHASVLQAKELNETVDDKVHTVHYVGRTVFRAKMRQRVEMSKTFSTLPLISII